MRHLILGCALIAFVLCSCSDSSTGPAKYAAGNFNLDTLQFSINGTQGSGSSWDLDNSAPDPIITITLNGASVFSTQLDNVYSGKLIVNHRIAIAAGDLIQVELQDEDLTTPDFIGKMTLKAQDLFTYNVGTPVPMTADAGTVSVKSVTLNLTQVQ